MGRPEAFYSKTPKRFLQTFLNIRKNNPNLTTFEVEREARMTHANNRTLVGALNEENFYQLSARKKEVMATEDRKKRVEYTRRVLKTLSPSYRSPSYITEQTQKRRTPNNLEEKKGSGRRKRASLSCLNYFWTWSDANRKLC